MTLMSDATYPLRTYDPFIDFMKELDNPLLAAGAAAVFTALVQSSSATTGVVILLASQGFISLEAGIALALGANVGTCATALLASIGKPRPALQASLIHVIFNVAGALIWIALVDVLAAIVRAISPSSSLIDEMERLAEETPRQIANAHTVFNVVNTLIFIWFTGPIAKFIEYVIPASKEENSGVKEPRFLNECFLDTPALALDCLRMEVGEMGACVNAIYKAFKGVDKEAQEEAMLKAQEDVNALDRAILTFAHQIGSKELPAKYATRLETLLGVTNDFQIICDIIVLHGTELSTKWDSLCLDDHAGENTMNIMREHHKVVQNALSCAVKAI
ncbi:sodium-dependent phosphate transport protein, partial [Kipferlia bialata]|eukprot:g9555.t1